VKQLRQTTARYWDRRQRKNKNASSVRFRSTGCLKFLRNFSILLTADDASPNLLSITTSTEKGQLKEEIAVAVKLKDHVNSLAVLRMCLLFTHVLFEEFVLTLHAPSHRILRPSITLYRRCTKFSMAQLACPGCKQNGMIEVLRVHKNVLMQNSPHRPKLPAHPSLPFR
jgi:hypothetical protein